MSAPEIEDRRHTQLLVFKEILADADACSAIWRSLLVGTERRLCDFRRAEPRQCLGRARREPSWRTCKYSLQSESSLSSPSWWGPNVGGAISGAPSRGSVWGGRAGNLPGELVSIPYKLSLR